LITRPACLHAALGPPSHDLAVIRDGLYAKGAPEGNPSEIRYVASAVWLNISVAKSSLSSS